MSRSLSVALARVGSLASLAAVLWLCSAVPASAWTEAAVRSVQAEVVVDRDANAHVTLHATVRVHGGWLEGLELAGLDPDLVLDEERPPLATDQDGQVYHPTVRVLANGRVQLGFPRTSPRRGQLMLDLAYRTSLAHRATEPVDGERVRVRWTLPGWRSGLDGVQIDVWAPEGAARGPRDLEDTGAAIHFDTVEDERGEGLRWRRAHLPRTLPWTVSVDVPASSMAAALRGPAMMALPPSPEAVESTPADTTPWFAGLGAALLLLLSLKLAASARLARAGRSVARGWLPGPLLVRVPVALASLAAVVWWGPTRPWLALAFGAGAVLLGAQRPGSPAPASQLGAWRTVDQRWLMVAKRHRIHRWLHPLTALDATTPLGALHAAAWLSLSLYPWIEAVEMRLLFSLLPLPLLLTGARLAYPAGPSEGLSRLLGRVGGLRRLPEGVALRPVMHVDVRGRVQDARVRTVFAHRPEGLLRCDLSLAHLRHAGGWTREPMLAVVTRAGSPAEAALLDAMPEVQSEPSRGGRRILRLLPVDGRRAWPALERVHEAFAHCPACVEVSRGAPTRHQTVHELPTPHAVGG